MTNYIVRAALHDEANEGWVWTSGFPSRSIVRIRNSASNRKVYCQVREIDDNFRNRYNESESNRHRLTDEPTLIMSQWFRDALGGIGTTDPDNRRGTADLTIERYNYPPLSWSGSLRAAAHHPEIVVRLGTYLGVLGLGLGVVGVLPAFLKIIRVSEICQQYLTLGGAVLVIIMGWLICRSPKLVRPK